MPNKDGRIFAARSRTRGAEATPAPSPAPSPAPADPPRATEAGERLSFAVDAAGDLAVDQLRPSTRDKLAKAFRKPAARTVVLGDAAPGKVGADDLALAAMLYDTVGSVLVSAVRAAGYPVDQAECMRYTAEEKSALCPMTASVLNKYVADFKYKDEALLAAMVVTITAAKFQTLKKPATITKFPQPAPATDEPAPAS